MGQRKAKCANRHHQRDYDDERLSPETVAEHTNANGEQGAGHARYRKQHPEMNCIVAEVRNVNRQDDAEVADCEAS